MLCPLDGHPDTIYRSSHFSYETAPLFSETFTDAELLDGRPIRLSRSPATPASERLTAAVVDRMVVHTTSQRTLGVGKRHSMTTETGLILGGLLRSAAEGRVAYAQRGREGGMWEGSPIGYKAFWARIGEMQADDLVVERKGIAGPERFGIWTGRPTRLWATRKLVNTAASCGVHLDDVGRHWRLSEAAKTVPQSVRRVNLVTTQGGAPAGLGLLCDHMERLNAHIATAAFSGCLFPVLTRRFGHNDLRLGGRLYAAGSEPYQTMKKADRRGIRIDGERTVEADVKASQLSIFLHLTARNEPLPRDPYALPGVDRRAVKAFCTQTFGAGKPPRRWADGTDDDVRCLKLADVRDVVLAAYPALADPTVILPADMKAAPPPKGECWAAGQFLVWRESEALIAALDDLEARGVVALPMHDGLLVKRSEADAAKEALRGAYSAVLGVNVRVNVE